MDFKKYLKLALFVILSWIIVLPIYFFLIKLQNLEGEVTFLTPLVILFAPLVSIIFGELINSKNKKERILGQKISKGASIIIDIFLALGLIYFIYIIFFSK